MWVITWRVSNLRARGWPRSCWLVPEEHDKYEQSYRVEFLIIFFKQGVWSSVKLINGSKVLWTKMSEQRSQVAQRIFWSDCEWSVGERLRMAGCLPFSCLRNLSKTFLSGPRHCLRVWLWNPGLCLPCRQPPFLGMLKPQALARTGDTSPERSPRKGAGPAQGPGARTLFSVPPSPSYLAMG